MENNLVVGDVVELNSGGPAMTITGITDTNKGKTAWCSWIHIGAKVEHQFPLVCVRKLPEKPVAS